LPAHRSVKRQRRRGAAMVELALGLTLLFPILLGVGAIAIRLGRTLQATQATRDIAHMYALGADFSLPGTQALAGTLSREYNLSSTGKAVLLFSRIMKVQQIDCDAAALHTCPNLNLPVLTQRIVMGNPSLRNSNFGTPPAAYIGTSGTISPVNYCQESSLVATGFNSVLALSPGQSTTMVEGYFSMPDINFLGFPDSGGGYYVRFLF
jgi:hypothetical protein